MDDKGWIKLHRKILENPIVCKDADYFAVWMYLLLEATHKECQQLFGGKKIMLQPGQLVTGRKKISLKLSVSESKVFRILNAFKNEHQIEQQTSNKNSLITILNWKEYQGIEQQNEQLVNNNRAASEQQVNSDRTTTEHKQEYKECKNVKNDKNERNNNPLYPPCEGETDEKPKRITLVSMIKDRNYDKDVEDVLIEWCNYKKEKHQSYKATGFSNLLTQIKNNIDKYGKEEVINVIRYSMANNWTGICFDRLKSNKESNRSENTIEQMKGW